MIIVFQKTEKGIKFYERNANTQVNKLLLTIPLLLEKKTTISYQNKEEVSGARKNKTKLKNFQKT